MAKKTPKKPKTEDIETEPSAWERFEHAVDAAVKSGPKHRVSPQPQTPMKSEKPKPKSKSAKVDND